MSQSYIITLFSNDIEVRWREYHEKVWESGKVEYIGSQLEICPDTQRIHWQAYVKFLRQYKQKGTWFKSNVSNGIHFTPVKKERAEAIGYGIKEDTRYDGPLENGTRPLPTAAKRGEEMELIKDKILSNNKRDIPFSLVLRYNLEKRWDGLRDFYFEDKRGSLPPFLPNPWGKVLPSCIAGKKRHFWIFSRQPDKGKTYYFAKPLAREFRSELIQPDGVYFNELTSYTEAVILDEYNSAKFKYDVLNSMCDGSYRYRRIYQASIKLNNPLIIVLSNQCIVDLYPHMNALLYARFKEIEII